METDCPRFGKLFRGCKFEPRYDEKLPDRLRNVWGWDADRVIEAAKVRIYVADVCVTCGKVIKRESDHG